MLALFLCSIPPSLGWLLIGINEDFLEVTNHESGAHLEQRHTLQSLSFFIAVPVSNGSLHKQLMISVSQLSTAGPTVLTTSRLKRTRDWSPLRSLR